MIPNQHPYLILTHKDMVEESEYIDLCATLENIFQIHT
jgi:hypothetical protein